MKKSTEDPQIEQVTTIGFDGPRYRASLCSDFKDVRVSL